MTTYPRILLWRDRPEHFGVAIEDLLERGQWTWRKFEWENVTPFVVHVLEAGRGVPRGLCEVCLTVSPSQPFEHFAYVTHQQGDCILEGQRVLSRAWEWPASVLISEDRFRNPLEEERLLRASIDWQRDGF